MGLAAELAKLAGEETSSTHVHASNINWQEVVTILTSTRVFVHSIWLDMVNLAQSTSWRLSYQMDGVNYRVFDSGVWTPGMDDGVHIRVGYVISHNLRLEIQSVVAEGAPRNVLYLIDWQNQE